MSGLTQQKTHPIQSDFASAIFFHSYESSTSNFDLSGSGSDEHGIFTSNSCGVPGTCKYTALRNCENVTLNNCSDCNPAASGLFGFLVVTIGFFILLGNSLILAVAARFYKKRTATKIDLLKVSLAIADLLTGFQILFITFPNFAWSMNSTIGEIESQVKLSRNSFVANANGIFYFLAYMSSLYHLLLLSLSRLYAIKWPFKYRELTNKTVYYGIGIVWVLAAIVASAPVWLPQFFYFDYCSITFLYLPRTDNHTAKIFLMFVFFVIPYILMTLLLILSAVLVRMQVNSVKSVLGQAKYQPGKFSNREIETFKTVSMMQFGFSVTLTPVVAVMSLLLSGYLSCDSFSTPYMICFYTSMANSLVNVLVYSVREKRFRSAVSDMFKDMRNTISDSITCICFKSSNLKKPVIVVV